MASKIRALVTEARWRGFWGTVRAVKLNKMGTMNCFVGEDSFKNRYFENKAEYYGRDRWVEYVDDRNPDSLKITPEWHAWLHHIIDTAPSEQPFSEPTYKKPATGNATGTSEAYVPPHHRLNNRFHGVAPEKFEPWKPSSSSKRPEPSDTDVLDLK